MEMKGRRFSGFSKRSAGCATRPASCLLTGENPIITGWIKYALLSKKGNQSMATATFDTYKFVRKLRKAGFNDQQEGIFNAAFQEHKTRRELATRANLR